MGVCRRATSLFACSSARGSRARAGFGVATGPTAKKNAAVRERMVLNPFDPAATRKELLNGFRPVRRLIF
jgi:hypothetical protein